MYLRLSFAAEYLFIFQDDFIDQILRITFAKCAFAGKLKAQDPCLSERYTYTLTEQHMCSRRTTTHLNTISQSIFSTFYSVSFILNQQPTAQIYMNATLLNLNGFKFLVKPLHILRLLWRLFGRMVLYLKFSTELMRFIHESPKLVKYVNS